MPMRAPRWRGSQPDARLSQRLHQPVDVPDHDVDLRVGAHLAIRAQEARRQVKADDAVAVLDRRELPRQQVARVVAERVDVGIRRHERGGRQARDVPEALLRYVRQVDHDPQRVARVDQPLAGLGQARAGVRTRGEPHRHAVREQVGAAPHRTQRPQPGRVEHVQQGKLGIQALRPLQVQDDREGAARDGVLHLAGAAAQGDRPGRGTFDPQHH